MDTVTAMLWLTEPAKYYIKRNQKCIDQQHWTCILYKLPLSDMDTLIHNEMQAKYTATDISNLIVCPKDMVRYLYTNDKKNITKYQSDYIMYREEEDKRLRRNIPIIIQDTPQ